MLAHSFRLNYKNWTSFPYDVQQQIITSQLCLIIQWLYTAFCNLQNEMSIKGSYTINSELNEWKTNIKNEWFGNNTILN